MLEAPRPLARSGGNDPPRASSLGCENRARAANAPHRRHHPHRRAPSRTRGRGGGRVEGALGEENDFGARCAELSGEQPTFQRTSTRRPRRLPPNRVFTRRTASVALHGASLASNHLGHAPRRRFTSTLRANWLFSDAPFSDRLPPDRMNDAGFRRPGAPSIHEASPFARVEFPRSS